LKVVGGTETDYKVLVCLSVSKQMLNEKAVEQIEASMLYGMLEIDRAAIQDHILTAVDLSPQTAAMVEVKKPAQLKPTKKRSKK